MAGHRRTRKRSGRMSPSRLEGPLPPPAAEARRTESRRAPARRALLLAAGFAALAGGGFLRGGEKSEDPPPTVLGIRGSRFTLNGEPAFLPGISYYGALGA